MAIAYKDFTSSGTWTAPAGVTMVWLYGWGQGGQGGGGGRSDNASGTTTTNSGGGGGGGGAQLSYCVIQVVPNTGYVVTIPNSSTSTNGAVANNTNGTPGSDGGNTTFGSLATFFGGKGGDGGKATGTTIISAGGPNSNLIPVRPAKNDISGDLNGTWMPGAGGSGGQHGTSSAGQLAGQPGMGCVFGNATVSSGGGAGATVTGLGGSGGGGGGNGGDATAIGANGGAGGAGSATTASPGSVGSAGAANSGVGGGGGGGGGNGATASGNGGNGGAGGSGFLRVIWND